MQAMDDIVREHLAELEIDRLLKLYHIRVLGAALSLEKRMESEKYRVNH